MSDQLDLYTNDEPRWASVRDEARVAVAAVTLKEFAFRCDVSPSAVADALAERDQKRLAARHLVKLIDIAPPQHQHALLVAICGPAGFRVERVAPLTPDEEVRRTRAYLAANAPGLLPGLEKVLGR